MKYDKYHEQNGKSNNLTFYSHNKMGACGVAWYPCGFGSKDLKEKLEDFTKLRSIEGLSDKWIYHIKSFIHDYLDFIEWKINYNNTLNYLSNLHKQTSTTSFRKRTYQIKKFLTYLKIEWANEIHPPSEPLYLPKRVTIDNINNTLSHFNGNDYFIQIKSLVLLGLSSGMRAEELYQLNMEDIDLNSRIDHINHDPNNGQSTKTKISRISFFTIETKDVLSDYISYFKDNCNLKQLFSQSHITRLFRDAPIKVKDLRKFFSQEWDRRGGPTSIKKILMGHSLKGDVDLMHYNCQSEEDLKKIYDKVMNEPIVI